MTAGGRLVCANADCAQQARALTRGYCHPCYVRWHRAGYPASGVPLRRKRAAGSVTACRHPACARRVRQLTQGYCRACYQRWWRQGYPAGGPVYRQAARAARLPATDETPAPRRRRLPRDPRCIIQCENCHKRVPSGRLCDACYTHWRRHGAPRPVRGRGALHQDSPACPCRSCALRRSYAAGHRRGTRPPQLNDWSPEEEAVLRRLLGTMPLPQLAAALSAEYGIPRSARAVEMRVRGWGMSQSVDAYTVRDIRRIFSVRFEVVKRWIADGFLEAQYGGERAGTHWAIFAPAVEAFIREHPGRYYWRGIRVRRWRNLAEIVARRAPWVPLTEIAVRYSVSETTLKRWIHAGRLPAVWQNGAGPRCRRWVVDANIAAELIQTRRRPNGDAEGAA